MKSLGVKFVLDLFLWTLTVPVALLLRLEALPPQYIPAFLLYLGVGIPIKAGVLYLLGLHRQAWSQVGVPDLWRLLRAVLTGTLVLFAVGLLLNRWVPFPRSVPLISGALAILALGGMRFGIRFWQEGAARRRGKPARRVLVVGAGQAGTMVVREMLRHPEAGLLPVGFLDDDPAKQRQRFLGLPVLGKLDALPQAVKKCRADEVLIAIPSAPGQVVRRVVERARESGVRYRIIPGIYEILAGKISISQIREVKLEDLLRRAPVRLELGEIAGYLADRVVLVTGAGGSIGSEIVRQVARFGPGEVLLLGRGENSLFELDEELKSTWPALRYRVLVADVRDWERVENLFRRYRPQVVFHAAAHKHVPLMELHPSEAVMNNVVGTKHVVDSALLHGVERFVNISTDKAVNPSSIMGASKRVAEYIVQWAARRARPGQSFVSVRFGNVLGSRGSVVPLFQTQIRRGGPVTVTHPDMRRYFMTIPEAAQLVLQAGGLGENGAVYVLDMGDPIRIVDLARDLIRLSGFEPDVDIKIEFTGVRPGEKLFEEILTAEEGTVASRHEKIYVARGEAPPDEVLEAGLAALLAAASSFDDGAVRRALKALVPSYEPEAK